MRSIDHQSSYFVELYQERSLSANPFHFLDALLGQFIHSLSECYPPSRDDNTFMKPRLHSTLSVCRRIHNSIPSYFRLLSIILTFLALLSPVRPSVFYYCSEYSHMKTLRL